MITSNQQKKIVVYHHNDHDGIMAAGILYNYLIDRWGFMDKNFEFIMIDYDKELNFDHIDFDKERVYFLDYSFSNIKNFENFKELLKRRKDFTDVYWFDHHITSVSLKEKIKEELGNLTVIPGIVNAGLCATALVYLYYYMDYTEINMTNNFNKFPTMPNVFLHSSEIPQSLKYIDDYDCWKCIFQDTNDFHYGLTISDPRDKIISELINEDDSELLSSIIYTGREIKKYLEFEDREYHVNMYGFEYTLPEEAGGFKCFCMNRKGNSLMFGDKVKEYDAVIPFYYINGKWKYSIFTDKDNVDCESIAKYYGGGGHKTAAGWVIEDLIFGE